MGSPHPPAPSPLRRRGGAESPSTAREGGAGVGALGRTAAPIIHVESFEGPLDLLLTLVERRRLPIAELSLVAVADQYLAQVRALPRIDPDALSEFLAIAAR